MPARPTLAHSGSAREPLRPERGRQGFRCNQALSEMRPFANAQTKAVKQLHPNLPDGRAEHMKYWPSPLLLAVGLSLVPWAAATQDADWDFHVDPSQERTRAGVQFSGGALVAVQCDAGKLSILLGGLPTAQTPRRSVLITREDGLSRLSVISAIEGSNLSWTDDARLARFLRASGQTTIASTTGDSRPFRMEIGLPTQPSHVDAVLSSCRYPLSDDRDALPDVSHLLTEGPMIEIPSIPRRYERIRVEVSCLVEAGRLSQCRSGHQTPSAPSIGAATARRANGQRVSLKPGTQAEAEGGVLDVVVVGSRIQL